ncbi:MAG: ABC transporter ATP-binding protein [Oligoflexales bacterium]|nr:ABC transporter ATP-binding protein [Oligoflexales bacterium]
MAKKQSPAPISERADSKKASERSNTKASAGPDSKASKGPSQGSAHHVSERSFLLEHMRPYTLAIGFATACSLFLGVLASAVSALVGPCLRILISPDRSQSFTFREMLGDTIGSSLELITQKSAFDHTQLMQIMPLALLGLSAAKGLFGTLQYFFWENISELVTKNMRAQILEAFLAMDPTLKKAGSTEEAELSSLVTTDIKLVREYLVHFFGGIPRELLKVLFLSVTLVLLSPKLFLLFFIGVLPSTVILSRLGKTLRRRASKALSDYSALSEWLQQRLLGVETIKHYRTEHIEETKFQIFTSGLFDTFYRAARVKAQSGPLIELVGVLSMVFVLYLCLLAISRGEFSGSVALSFFTSLAVLAQSGAVLARYFNKNREGAAATSRILSLLSIMRSQKGVDTSKPYKLQEGPWLLKLEKVSASYEGREVLHDLSFSFEPGKIYGVVGPSGSGKSTLIHTLLGLQKLDQGQLLYNPRFLHSGENISYMPQNAELMNGTIAENISYPLDPEPDRIRNLISEMGLDQQDWTQDLLEKKKLSGGQMQMVHLLRLLYHAKPLLLIDEGTSALDPEMEKLFCEFFVKKLQKLGSTLIMVTHRPSAMSYLQEIIHLEQGKFVART